MRDADELKVWPIAENFLEVLVVERAANNVDWNLQMYILLILLTQLKAIYIVSVDDLLLPLLTSR